MAFCGYELEKDDDMTFLIAEPEKAVIDYLYLVSLGKKTLNDRLDIKSLSYKKLVYYASFFQRVGLKKLLKATWQKTQNNQLPVQYL